MMRAWSGHPQGFALDRSGRSGDRRTARRQDRQPSARRASWRCSIGLRGAGLRAGLGARGLPTLCRDRWSGFCLISGERVVRVSTKLMAGARAARAAEESRMSSTRLAVARAALREGIESLADRAARRALSSRSRLLVDHRERLVRQRVALNNDLLWNLHDLWPELKLTGRRSLSSEAQRADRSPPRTRRADRPGSDRARRTAALARADRRGRRARGRDRRPRRPGRAAAARRARLRTVDRGQVDRRDRRRRPLRERRKARSGRRASPDSGQLGQDQPPPTRPRRQPPAQRRALPNRAHPGPLPPRTATTSLAYAPRQDPTRSDAQPQRHLVRRSGPPPEAPPDHRASPNDIFLDIGAARAAAGRRRCAYPREGMS